MKDLAVASGVLGYELIDQYEQLERNCLNKMYTDRSTAYLTCDLLAQFLETIDGQVDGFDL